MDKYTLYYKNKSYRVAEITIFKGTSEEEEILVGTTELEKKLLTDISDSSPEVAKEAEYLDNGIAFYITAEEMLLPPNRIIQIVEANYY